MNSQTSIIHPTGSAKFAKPGITTSSIRGISTKKAWIVTAANAVVDYCKVFIQSMHDYCLKLLFELLTIYVPYTSILKLCFR